MYFTAADIDFAESHGLPTSSWSVGRDCTGKACRGGPSVDVIAALRTVNLDRFEAVLVDALTTPAYPAEWVREDMANSQIKRRAPRLAAIAEQLGASGMLQAIVAAKS